MLKSSHRSTQVENYTLRSALMEADKELLKHRTLISELRSGNKETSERIMKIFAKKETS